MLSGNGVKILGFFFEFIYMDVRFFVFDRPQDFLIRFYMGRGVFNFIQITLFDRDRLWFEE